MRIIFTSDTHGLIPDLPPGDVLVHTGDLTRSGSYLETARCGEWLNSLDYREILFVPGNHDFLFQEEEKKARRLLGKVRVLIDQELILGRVKFYGTPWQPNFFDWAFNVADYSERAQLFQKIPQDTDILLTHVPPFGTLDRTLQGVSVGDAALSSRIAQLTRLKIHAFGHIHFSYGRKDTVKTFSLNASYCNEGYQGANAPWIVDI